LLQGEPVRLVSISSQTGAEDDDHDVRGPAREFEVVRRLGSGSYAVVYLVKEVLSHSVPSEDGHMSTIGPMEFDGNLSRRSAETVYGREYAIKCLSKANLDEEALDAQLTEVCTPCCVDFVGAKFKFPGYHSSVTALSPQYCHSPQDSRDLFLSPSIVGIRPR
jgi:serine/threonine protein kinase